MAELYKRDGSPFWYAVLSDPRAPDGTIRRSTKSRGKIEARQIAAGFQSEIDTAVLTQIHDEATACGLSWLEALTMFVAEGDIKKSTAASHANIGPIVVSILGDFDLGQLTEEHITTYVDVRRRQTVKPYRAKDTGRRVSDVTIRKHLSTMSAVYKFVMNLKLPNAPKVNPFKVFDRSHLKTSKKVDSHLRPAQFELALSVCKSSIHRTMLITLVGTGMRSSEMLDLYWGEIDFKDDVIEFGNVDPDRSKTSRSRRIPLLSVVSDTLRAHRETMVGYDPNGRVFPSTAPGHEGQRRYDIKYLIKMIRARTTLQGYKNHGLRHSFASWALQQGIDADAIRRSLGHTSYSTTDRYAHHIDDSMKAQFLKLKLPVSAQNATQTPAFSADIDADKGDMLMNTTT